MELARREAAALTAVGEENPWEQVLRRAGAGDGLIAAIDGYVDFAQLGSDSLAEDSVRRTEFGLVRRMSEPFPPQKFGQTMG